MVYDIIKKFGIIKLIIIITFFTVVLSGGATALTLYLVTGDIYLIGLLLSILVPGIVAPPQLFFYFHSIVKQNEVEIKLKKAHAQLEIEYKIAFEQQEELRRLNNSMEEIVAERTQKLQETLKEKDTLLSEIHHRVKNNLQIVISLMQLRKKTLKKTSEAQILTDIETKIMAMALVHEQLYSERSFSKINMKLFLSKLINNIFLSYSIKGDQITIVQDVDPVSLELTYAIPLCIIITEIITNSIKYAFPETREGTINLAIKDIHPGSIIVLVQDNGSGCHQLDYSSLGIKIIKTLVEQLDGTIEMKTNNGVSYRIIVPVKKYLQEE
jgi:two-component sensor histidine kinase